MKTLPYQNTNGEEDGIIDYYVELVKFRSPFSKINT